MRLKAKLINEAFMKRGPDRFVEKWLLNKMTRKATSFKELNKIDVDKLSEGLSDVREFIESLDEFPMKFVYGVNAPKIHMDFAPNAKLPDWFIMEKNKRLFVLVYTSGYDYARYAMMV
jgi:hypothetical protein